jgi:nondiscriminating aspartyl-tRNA synthetase
LWLERRVSEDSGDVYLRICGWIIRLKSFKKIVIIEVSGNNSVKPYVLVFKKNEDPVLFEKAMGLKVGAAICFEGEKSEVQKSRRGVEYRARSITVYSQPIDPLPVDTIGKVPALLDTRIKYRYLLLRNPVEKAVFRIRAGVLKAARQYLEREGFLEIHTPKIVAAGAEGGATLFPVKYFENRAYLSQSPQLYKQMLTLGNNKKIEN